jgi:hypothetical protein
MTYPLPYIAGLVDADGVIGLRTTKKSKTLSHEVALNVGMCHREVPETLRSMFGGGLSPYRPPSPRHRVCWIWSVSGDRAAHVAGLLLPWLVVKRRQAEIIIEYQSTRLAPGDRWNGVPDELVKRRRVLFEEMASLNRRGPRPTDLEAVAS